MKMVRVCHPNRQKTNYFRLKRFFDFIFSLFLMILLLGPMVLVGILIKCTSKGSVLYWSKRIGRFNRVFDMPKFRTMRIETPEVATHLIQQPDDWLTPVGKVLRRFSIDEFPQLWNILKGEMSFVGPRPALFNQDDLVALRQQEGVDQLVPGLTGWAQINGRDQISMDEKVELDAFYLNNGSIAFDCKILFLTLFRVSQRDGIAH